nr:relaxase/mobilization nuclease domain-containing protein [Dinghuibacter silviterrae]
MKAAEAKLLMACGFPRDAATLSFRNKLERFELLTRQNERTRTNAMHIFLSFSVYDKLDEDRLKLIALEYMERIGFGNQPFIVYQHVDTANPHIHIASVNIEDGGQRIETHNIGRVQSEQARKEIERLYDLVRAQDQQRDTAYLLQSGRLQNIVREVVGTYKFTSLPELNAVLRQFDIAAYRGEEGSKMYEKGGLVYLKLGLDGERVGLPIKASSIYSSPTLKNLQKKYEVNEAARKPYSQRLKHQLDKALSSGGREAMESLLQNQGIQVLLRSNEQGQVYGVTFIDNGTRVIFNGSDLGKNYSAKAFMERLPDGWPGIGTGEVSAKAGPGTLFTDDKMDPMENGQETAYPGPKKPVIMIVTDTPNHRVKEENAGETAQKKKRRLQVE